MVTTPKVLIIDDSNTECLFMRQALQGAGYQVLVANNGHQGIQLLAQENPRCLILDIVLPGMSGFEVCRHIRSQSAYQNMPIIMVSTKNSTSDRFWAKRQGADYYLPKPFKGDALIGIVKDVLAEHADTPAASSPFAISQPDDILQARMSGTPRSVNTPPPRSTGEQRPVNIPPPRSTGEQRPVNIPPLRSTGEQRPVGINAKSVNETVNPYHESGMPFVSGTTGAQRPMNARATGGRIDPQTPPVNRTDW
jgi:CheY-like chemotaxis protein